MFYENSYKITVLILRNFYLKKETGRSSSHIGLLCITVVEYRGILLTPCTICRHFNSLYADATNSIVLNDLTQECQ
jgi:hypothetical protein